MGQLLYLLAVSCYHFGIRFTALFNAKARAWVEGRKDWRSALMNWRNQQAEKQPIVWMHCASLGEFEQGRPVLELLRKEYPSYAIVLSFYSPSGYQQQAHYLQADYVCYLPADHPVNARDWVRLLQPSLVIFVKYEFWAFHLQALFRQGIPCVLIAASFRANQVFFRWYGGFFLRLLKTYHHIFVQSSADQQLLSTHSVNKVSVAGDPRIDRVLEIADSVIEMPLIASFRGDEHLLVAGSSWPPDEEILLKDQSVWEAASWKLLIAPHDISEAHIQAIEQGCTLPVQRYSQIKDGDDLGSCRILILDTIGMLSRVYHYGDIAYIGGGFGRGIHNTLEPAAHGLPILFGPNHYKFQEALTLKKEGGAFEVKNHQDFIDQLRLLQQESSRASARQVISAYLERNRGVAATIVSELKNKGALE